MFEGNRFFPLTGNSHSKDAFQQYAIGGLRAGPVHRCYVDAEIVDDALLRALVRPVLDPGPGLLSPFGGIPFR